MSFTVEPGLYGVSQPDAEAPVLVTANYKLSFDHLRRHLHTTAAWIVVLETHGINVWCAAGKGTFGTSELCRQLATAGLDKLVRHRQIIVPQLGAPGVAAHEVRRCSGFRVVYGPVLAKDLPAFLAAGQQATPAMRTKTFPLAERAILIPVELLIAMKWGLLLSVVLFLLGGLARPLSAFWTNAVSRGSWWVLALWSGIVGGAVLTPLLLPVLPGRAFSVKGLAAGAVMALVFAGAQAGLATIPFSWAESAGMLLLIAAIASFLGLEFTGASTYTSLSGVKKEMRLALPAQIGGGLIAVVLLAIGGILR